jgi:hypothetical protein
MHVRDRLDVTGRRDSARSERPPRCDVIAVSIPAHSGTALYLVIYSAQPARTSDVRFLTHRIASCFLDSGGIPARSRWKHPNKGQKSRESFYRRGCGGPPPAMPFLILAKAKELPAVFLGFPESQSDNLIKAHWDLHYGAN